MTATSRRPRRLPRFVASVRRGDDERGVALLVVMGVMTMVLLMAMSLATSTLAQLPIVTQQQEHEQALEAAEAGISDFTSYINNDANYWNQASALSANPAFSGWVQVPGAANNESFRYYLNSTNVSQGYLTLEVSGCAAGTYSASTCKSGVIRTVEVELRPEGFLDYGYFTNNELANPATTPGTTCVVYHAWQLNGVTDGNAADEYGPTGNCSDELGIWTSGDVFNGPVHTNDAFRFCADPVFNKHVDSYFAAAPSGTAPGPNAGLGGSSETYLSGWLNNKFDNPTCSAAPTFNDGGIRQGLDLLMPSSNTALQTDVDAALPGGDDGCLFSGYTQLSMYYVGTTGYLTYSSPYTNFAGNTWNAALCGTPATGTTAGTITIPSTGIVAYVQAASVSSTTSADVTACEAATQIGAGPGQCAGDLAIGDDASPPTGGTGGLAGQLTAAAADGIQIDNNLEYQVAPPGGKDLLGLISENDIMLVHDPSGGSTACPGQTPSTNSFCENPTIDAAMLSIQGSFYVQNWGDGGLLGAITVDGSVATNYDGITGVANSNGTLLIGYNENLDYDRRLAFTSPPYYLSPGATSWNESDWTELTACATPGTGC